MCSVLDGDELWAETIAPGVGGPQVSLQKQHSSQDLGSSCQARVLCLESLMANQDTGQRQRGDVLEVNSEEA